MPAVLSDGRLWIVIISCFAVAMPFVAWRYGENTGSSGLTGRERLLLLDKLVIGESLLGMILLIPVGRVLGGCADLFAAPSQCSVNAPAWIWMATWLFVGIFAVSALL